MPSHGAYANARVAADVAVSAQCPHSHLLSVACGAAFAMSILTSGPHPFAMQAGTAPTTAPEPAKTTAQQGATADAEAANR